ncbi:MAG TPA: ATP-binding protein [Polyangiaceae bacterium]
MQVDSGLDADLLRLLVDSVKDYAIFMLTTDGRIASWNRGAQRIKGYEAPEIIGKHFSVFYPREDVEAGKCEYELEVAARVGRFEDEGWRLRKDGSRFWANVVITALRDGDGKLRGFGKVTRDLTERVQAEQERLRRARAEEAERQKEEFLAIVGHELRNPLAPMHTAVHLLKLRRGVGCDREIGVLERQLVHMMRLLDDLLDISRMLRGNLQLASRVTELSAVLANAVDVSAPLIEQKGHRLQLDVPTAPIWVNVDLVRMTQVFANLLNNAAKYTDPGGEIRVRARLEAGQVVVAVEDTGIGLARDSVGRIFDLFVQAATAKERRLGGFGIGLAIAKRLVAAHGGDIKAESEGPGRGSRFVVTLPEAVPERDETPAAASSTTRATVRRRVLLVDDDEDSAMMLEALLTQLGHDVQIAHDAARALEVAEEFGPHIAFLDLALPGIDGLELARRLRRIPACANVPLVALSGYARESDRQAALKAGFTAHFAKPVDVSDLQRVIEGSRERAAG